MGTVAAIRSRVVDGHGVAVLRAYLVADDRRRERLVRLLLNAALKHDYFRLVFRDDDRRKTLYENLAEILLRLRLK